MASRTIRGVRAPLNQQTIVGRLKGTGAAQEISLTDLATALGAGGIMQVSGTAAPSAVTVAGGTGIGVTVAGSAYTVALQTPVTVAHGGTGADLSATGGASKVLKQSSAGAPVTVGQLATTDLSDVSTASLTDGQVLTYVAAASKWENKALPTDTDTLATLGDVALSSPADTQVLTYHSATSKWINAAASGGGSSTLAADTDVSITSPSDGQVLTYVTADGKWENKALPTDTDTLATLGDVSLSSPADTQVLTYHSATSKWINAAAGGGGSSTLAGDTDVSITSAAGNDILYYNSGAGKWENETFISLENTLGWPNASWHTVCVVASTTALPGTPTYSNGTSGVGATLTASSNGALVVDGETADGTTLNVGNRVLVAGQADTKQNGIYTITQNGDASHPYILTRATDFDGNALTNGTLIVGLCVSIAGGTANANSIWMFAGGVPSPLVFGTSTILFSFVGGSTVVTSTGGVSFLVSSPAANDVLYYNSGAGKWENTTVAALLAATGGEVYGGAIRKPTISGAGFNASTGWVNQGSNTVADTTPGIYFNATAANLTNNTISGLLKSISLSTPYKITALISRGFNGNNVSSCGPCIGFSDGTKYMTIGLVSINGTPQLKVDQWTTTTAYSGSIQGTSGAIFGTRIWVQLYHDGTTIHFQSSADGTNFVDVSTQVASAGFLGGNWNHVFIGLMNPNSAVASKLDATIESYLEH